MLYTMFSAATLLKESRQGAVGGNEVVPGGAVVPGGGVVSDA